MKSLSNLLGLATLATLVNAQFQADGASFKSPVTVATGYKASVVFSNATAPRGIAFDSQDNLLVVERGLGVTAYTRATALSSGWQRTVVVKNANLTHGIEIDRDLLLVSTATTVLAYRYNATTKSVDTAPYFPYVLADGLPGDGELTTHTLLIEKDSRNFSAALLVGTGPLTNIDVTARDPTSGRSQIRRLKYPNVTVPVFPPIPLHYGAGQILAYGIRNPAGFAFYDSSPVASPGSSTSFRLAVVENGASIDNVTSLTSAFVNDNPADELNVVTYSDSGTSVKPLSYGFPDCTTLWNPKADPVGVPQYVNLPKGDQISLNLDATYNDAWCREKSNNQPPALSFQAHSVPLDIKFYKGPTANGSTSIPASVKGQAFVSFHGSFNRSPPTGYGVVSAPRSDSTNGLGYSFVVQAKNLASCPGTCIRPVGLAFSQDGRLFVSSDSSGEIFVLEYIGAIMD